MTPNILFQMFKKSFGFDPTSKQNLFFKEVAQFLMSEGKNEIFILKGYAGTGKTSVITAVIKNLQYIKKQYILLAPTGRAAKVISNYTGQTAQTIHKKIYFSDAKSGGLNFTLQKNKHKDTIFIIDEASMISNQETSENGSLLEDLIRYVYSGVGCKIIFIGDTAQLPPVNSNISPALDANELEFRFDKKVSELELDEVMRQETDSGILHNATNLRELLESDFYDSFAFELRNFKDIIRLSDGYEIQDAIQESYYKFDQEETSFIVRSNKRANQYNQQIRNKILDRESELSVGDLLMVVKNNYYWIKSNDEASFIANGDIIEVLEIFKIIELYGYKFAQVKIRMIDYPNQKPFETTLILDTIHSESPSLTYEESNKLYQEILLDFESESSNYKKHKKVKESEFYNALQVKFAYAMTCHKSQGGQWDAIFIEQPYLPNGIDKDYIRWLYTALTRAKKKVYLIGFKDDHFED